MIAAAPSLADDPLFKAAKPRASGISSEGVRKAIHQPIDELERAALAEPQR